VYKIHVFSAHLPKGLGRGYSFGDTLQEPAIKRANSPTTIP
jgi:hypothetical protein